MSAIKNFYHDQICEGMQEANEETQKEMDRMLIAEYEAKKKEVLNSNIPAWISQDPSIF